MLADRMEDLTDPERIRTNKKCDRTVSLYGYVRGTNLKQNSAVHIPGVFIILHTLDSCNCVPLLGCGDFTLRSTSLLPDPCPLPDKTKKRSLNEKEKLIYGPMAGVGGIMYDKVYPMCWRVGRGHMLACPLGITLVLPQ